MSNEIFRTLAGATGLPSDLISQELGDILAEKGIPRDEVTLDQLREVLASYLRDVIIEAKDKFEGGVWIEDEISPEELGKD